MTQARSPSPPACCCCSAACFAAFVSAASRLLQSRLLLRAHPCICPLHDLTRSKHLG
jgi:hypothetical protein